MAIVQTHCIFDPVLEKPKCVRDTVDFFNFRNAYSKMCLVQHSGENPYSNCLFHNLMEFEEPNNIQFWPSFRGHFE